MSGPVDVLDRYAMADALDGRPGFDRTKFFIADAARGYMSLAHSFRDYKPEAVPRLRSEAARRFCRLREMRRAARAKATGGES